MRVSEYLKAGLLVLLIFLLFFFALMADWAFGQSGVGQAFGRPSISTQTPESGSMWLTEFSDGSADVSDLDRFQLYRLDRLMEDETLVFEFYPCSNSRNYKKGFEKEGRFSRIFDTSLEWLRGKNLRSRYLSSPFNRNIDDIKVDIISGNKKGILVKWKKRPEDPADMLRRMAQVWGEDQAAQNRTIAANKEQIAKNKKAIDYHESRLEALETKSSEHTNWRLTAGSAISGDKFLGIGGGLTVEFPNRKYIGVGFCQKAELEGYEDVLAFTGGYRLKKAEWLSICGQAYSGVKCRNDNYGIFDYVGGVGGIMFSTPKLWSFSIDLLIGFDVTRYRHYGTTERTWEITSQSITPNIKTTPGKIKYDTGVKIQINLSYELY